MSEVIFPSGQWVGFYTYPNVGGRHLMDLILEFRDGTIAGEGADPIGFFGIHGRYYAKEAECRWTKTYFRAHSVEYHGYREKKGIWGTWSIGQMKGGFHIWPIGEGATLDYVREEQADESPLQQTLHPSAHPTVQPAGTPVAISAPLQSARSLFPETRRDPL
jgi:hypothetical protein